LRKFKFTNLLIAFLLIFSTISPTVSNATTGKEKPLRKSQIKVSNENDNQKIPTKAELKKTSTPTKDKIVSELKEKLKEKTNKGIEQKEKYVPDELIIKYKKNTDTFKISSLQKKFSFKQSKKLNFINAEVVKIPKEENISVYIKELKKDPSVQSVQPNYKYYASDLNNAPNYYSKLWGINNTGQQINEIPGVKDIDIDGPEARAKFSGLKEVIVGVIDTGVDINHPDLQKAIWTNPKEIPNDGIDNDKNGYIDDVHGWDFYNDDNTVYDLFDGDEHGTHVSGTIAATLEGTTTNTNKGVVGIAPNVKILPIKFLGPDGGTSEQAIQAIEYAQKMGIKITNNSWVGGEYDPLLEEAIKNYNGLFVAAAGNEGMNNDINQSYPANFNCSNILSVAAVDNQGNLAEFSNYGAKNVDVAAPGVNILSTVPKYPADEIKAYLGLKQLGASAQISNTKFGFKAIFDGIGYENYSETTRQDAFDKALSYLGIPKDKTKKVLLVQDDEHDIGPLLEDIPELKNYFKDYYLDYKKLLTNYNTTFININSDSSISDYKIKLSDYDAVVWFTGHGLGLGSEEFTTLTEDDVNTLSGFLEKGGRLLLTGGDALVSQEQSYLVEDLLGLNVLSDFGPHLNVQGLSGTIYEGKKYNIDFLESPFPNADFLDSNNPNTRINLKYVSDYSQAYSYYSGTSMATPHVTGTAALLMGLYSNMSPELLSYYISNKGKTLEQLTGFVNSSKIVKASNLNSFDDNKFPGTPLLKNINYGSLSTTDRDDVFAISLKKGEIVNMSLKGHSGTDFDLYLYNSSAKDIRNANNMVSSSENANSSKESIKYTAPDSGVYYIDVYSFKGTGSYKLEVGNFGGSYEDDSGNLSFDGAWKKYSNSLLSNGSAISLNSNGEVSFTFVGTSFEWKGFKDITQGLADIYVDGKKEASPSLYSSSFKAKQSLFKKDYSYGQHTVRITWTGKSDPSARKGSASINVDQFIVKSIPSTLNAYYDSTQKYPVITWGSTQIADSYNIYRKAATETDFRKLNSSPLKMLSFKDTTASFGKTYEYAVSVNTKDNQVTGMSTPFTFTYDDDIKGSILIKSTKVYGNLDFAKRDRYDVWSKKLEKGKAYEINLTGPANTNFDLYLFKSSSSTIYGTKAAKKSTNSNSTEKITFKPDSTGVYYIVPTAKSGLGKYTLSLTVQTTKRVENTNSSLNYSGKWPKVSYSSASGGSIKQSNTSTSYAEYSFTGTGVSLLALKDKNMGIADIYIDGTKVKQVNFYASSRKYKQTVFNTQNLENKEHKIKIVPTGKKNNTATGTYINIDALDVTHFVPLN
jgi:subtilisin family serine protease